MEKVATKITSERTLPPFYVQSSEISGRYHVNLGYVLDTRTKKKLIPTIEGVELTSFLISQEEDAETIACAPDNYVAVKLTLSGGVESDDASIEYAEIVSTSTTQRNDDETIYIRLAKIEESEGVITIEQLHFSDIFYYRLKHQANTDDGVSDSVAYISDDTTWDEGHEQPENRYTFLGYFLEPRITDFSVTLRDEDLTLRDEGPQISEIQFRTHSHSKFIYSDPQYVRILLTRGANLSDQNRGGFLAEKTKLHTISLF